MRDLRTINHTHIAQSVMLFVFYFLFLFTILLWLLLLLLFRLFFVFLSFCICVFAANIVHYNTKCICTSERVFLCVRVSESEIVIENNQENLSEGYFVCIYFMHVDHACNSHIPIRAHVVQSLLLSRCTHRTLATVHSRASICSAIRWSWRAQSYQTRVNGLRIVCIVYVYHREQRCVYGKKNALLCVPVLICISYVHWIWFSLTTAAVSIRRAFFTWLLFSSGNKNPKSNQKKK